MDKNEFFCEVGNFIWLLIRGKQTNYKKNYFFKNLEKTWTFDGINIEIR